MCQSAQYATEPKGSYGSSSGVFPPALWLSNLAEQAVLGNCRTDIPAYKFSSFNKTMAHISCCLFGCVIAHNVPEHLASPTTAPGCFTIIPGLLSPTCTQYSKTLFLISSWRTEVTKSLRWNWSSNPTPQLSSQHWSLLQPYLASLVL